MPLEELLAMYGYAETGGDTMASSNSEEDEEEEDEELAVENEEADGVMEVHVEQYSELQQLYVDELPTASSQGMLT